MSGFFDPDYARDKRIAELQRRVSALEQRVLDLERATPAKNGADDRLSEAKECLETRDEPSSPPEDELSKLSGGWEPIETAPRDGTPILAWTVHANAKYSKDPFGEGWACVSLTHWIDHNGGGWTWHGLCGEHVLWHPLPALPQDHAPLREEDHGEG